MSRKQTKGSRKRGLLWSLLLLVPGLDVGPLLPGKKRRRRKDELIRLDLEIEQADLELVDSKKKAKDTPECPETPSKKEPVKP